MDKIPVVTKNRKARKTKPAWTFPMGQGWGGGNPAKGERVPRHRPNGNPQGGIRSVPCGAEGERRPKTATSGALVRINGGGTQKSGGELRQATKGIKKGSRRGTLNNYHDEKGCLFQRMGRSNMRGAYAGSSDRSKATFCIKGKSCETRWKGLGGIAVKFNCSPAREKGGFPTAQEARPSQESDSYGRQEKSGIK